MKNILAACLLIATAFLTGCMSFTYGGQKFSSEQEALAFQDKHLGAGVQSIQPATTKIGGILKIHVPNEEATRERGITGNKSGTAADYIIKSYVADQRKLKEVFERRGSFDAVELIFSNGQHQTPSPPNHVLYLYLESTTTLGWYYVGTKVPRTPVSYDRGTANMGERYKFMIESVESLAMAEKIASKK